MSTSGRNLKLAAASGLLVLGGCDLSKLIDEQIAEFEKLIPKYGVENIETTIGEQGGTAVTEHGGLSVPEGAVQGDVMVAVYEAAPGEIMAPLPSVMEPVTPPMAFTPHGTKFLKDVQLSLFFDKNRTSADMFVVRLDNEQDMDWEVVDAQIASGVANVTTNHFSIYGVVSCSSSNQALADLCKALKSGDIDLDDVLEMAPSDGGWQFDDGDTPGTDGPGGTADGGVSVDPRPEPDAGGDVDCRARAEECKPVLEACYVDPRAAECEKLDHCIELLSECGMAPSGDLCADLSAACAKGDRAACEAFNAECASVDEPGCEDLRIKCERGDSAACDELGTRCGGGGTPPCDDIAAACERGDQRACTDWELFCKDGEEPLPASCDDAPGHCEQLACECQLDGIRESCNAFQLECTDGEPPPPPSCDQASSACEKLACDCQLNGNDSACQTFQLECGSEPPPPPPSPCETLFEECVDLNQVDACEAYEAEDCGTCTLEEQCGGEVCWQEHVCTAPPASDGEPEVVLLP